MTGFRQVWLVARREVVERGRTLAFRLGTLAMLAVVVAAIALPEVLGSSGGTKDVGLTGSVPAGLPTALQEQGAAAGTTIRVHRDDDVSGGEQAVRDREVDVLVVDGTRLAWLRDPDEQLQVIVVGAIQRVAVEERAAAAGIDPGELSAVLAPVPVESTELGLVAGRGPDDETAAALTGALLLVAIATYGGLVLTGVVEEKSNRVVEVLLARMPPRNLLAGKVAGIGVLGLAQLVLVAVAAVVTVAVVGDVELPSVSAGVLAWVVVWFVLGYVLYAVAYGALGSLASRPEDAQGAAGPVTVVLIAGYWAALVAVAGDPDSTWSLVLSLFPLTAPFAMPGRLALGAATWWEPVVAALFTVATIGVLVVAAGRVYTRAILHTGARLRLREVWRSDASGDQPMRSGVGKVHVPSRTSGRGR